MNLANLYTKRQWIAELARAKPKKVLFSLHHGEKTDRISRQT